jgi:hypothetical protein
MNAGNERSVFTKRGEFLDKLKECSFLRKGSAPWICMNLRLNSEYTVI